MTVTVRPYRKGGWEVDIVLTFPGRPKIRERRKAPVRTKSAAKRWGEDRERQLIQHYTSTDPDEDDDDRPDLVKKETPTLAQFAPRYLEGHCEANRLRPATIDQKKRVIRNHLVPVLGKKRLDRIKAEDVQRLKASRKHLAPTSLNNVLTLLRAILNVAVEWGVIDALPTKVKKIKHDETGYVFYDFEELDLLVLTAEQLGDPNLVLTVLLAGEAGLRCGEMVGLEWSDIDLRRDTLMVNRSVWRGVVTPPKGGRSRSLPIATRLREALVKHRHLRGPRVLVAGRGKPPGTTTVRCWLAKVQREAGFPTKGPHALRHTFCSHLAMRGAPPQVIKEYAGHRSLHTTERYTHLSPKLRADAIHLLDRPQEWRHVGDGPKKVKKLK
ncbi:MAG: site-specific integrase [Myxococcales bacterium]|nr:site-specific integrase [Myxococcales bacterium]